ncbi:MAG: hypothetical protein U0J65_05725 [Christensenellales bacterium]|nr:hypothetical protein [Christensenellales bacterium]
MANTIEKVALIQKALDQAMIQGAVTGFMEANALDVKYSGGNEVKIPSVVMDGLANYDRATGFVEGDVTLAYQTMKLTQDRGRGFTIDEMDVDESGVLDLVSKLAGEFQRTKVIPEVDAYRMATLCALAGKARRRTYSAAAASVFTQLTTDIGAVQDEVGSDVQLVVLINQKVATMMNNSTEISKKLNVVDFARGEIKTKVKAIDETALLPVPSARMHSRITVTAGGKGGYTAAEGAAAINWIVTAKNGPIAVSKTDKMRLFDPETYQKARAWHMDYRKFHDLWLPDNKKAATFVNLAAEDASLS